MATMTEMEEMAKYDTALRRWRLSHQLSQAALAQRCGMQQRTLSRYENGERIPYRHIEDLRRVTRLSYEALLHPLAYLQAHPGFLAEYAAEPQQSPGRPRRRPDAP